MKEFSKVTALDIYGQNELNRILNEILPDTLEQLKKHEGKKLYKADGNRTEATKFEIKTPENGKIDGHARTTTATLSRSSSYLWLKLKICYNGGDYQAVPRSTYYAQYFEKEVYLGKLNGQILEEVSTLETIQKDYNLNRIFNIEEINEKIQQYNDLLNQLSHKSNEIPYFFKK